MDRRERIFDPEETLRMSQEAHQSRIWTALPGIVQAFRAGGPTGQVVDVQPAIKGQFIDRNGVRNSVQLPVLLDCPVLWQGGGGVTLTFPIKPGDECLVVFASRCIDGWWSQGGVQDQAELRMHDLSDGFALVGVRSVPRAFLVDTDAAQLRTDDGTAYVSLNPSTREIKVVTSSSITANAGGSINATAGGSVSITAPSITLNGNVTINGSLSQTGGNASMTGSLTVTGDVSGGGKSLKTHTHGGVQSGSGNSGPPN